MGPAADHSAHRERFGSASTLPREWTVLADPQILASALMNLLNNAFKYTEPGGRVVLSGQAADGRILIEVEDECGGIPDMRRDLFQAFGERRGTDRSGVGLGLSIARKAVTSQDGNIGVRNIPGKGCVFVIDVPLAPPEEPSARRCLPDDTEAIPRRSPRARVSAAPGRRARAAPSPP